jgi:hypothetical protein
MSLIEPHIIDISSDYAQSSSTASSSNFTVSLPTLDQRYNRVAIVSASIPKTYYNIAAPYNVLILTEGKTNTTITVPPANYSFNSFASTLSTLLTAASTASITYTATPQLATGRMLIASNSAAFSTITIPGTSNLYKNLGTPFNSAITINNVTPYTSADVCTFTINVILITSSLVRSSGMQGLPSNILQIININNQQNFSSIAYDNFNTLYNSRPATVSTSATFTITDIDGTILDLNGIPCNFSVIFFRFDDTNMLVRQNLYFEHANRLLSQSQDVQQSEQQAEQKIQQLAN